MSKKKWLILSLGVLYLWGAANWSEAKAKRGAQILVVIKSGFSLHGELIAVKPGGYLVLLTDQGVDETFHVAETKTVKIVKRSKVVIGALSGLAIGTLIGSLHGTTTETYDSELRFLAFIVYGGGGALLGTLIGGSAGLLAGKDEVLNFEKMTPNQSSQALEKLRSRARIRNLQ